MSSIESQTVLNALRRYGHASAAIVEGEKQPLSAVIELENSRLALIALAEGGTPLDLVPFYRSIDDGVMAGAYIAGHIEDAQIIGLALTLIDAITMDVVSAAPLPFDLGGRKFRWAVHLFGRSFADDAVAILEDALPTMKRIYARVEADIYPSTDGVRDYGAKPDRVIAPLDNVDPRLEEVGYTPCKETDLFAAPITEIHVDSDMIDGLMELADRRGKAALAALRGLAGEA